MTQARKYFKFGNKRVQKHLKRPLPSMEFRTSMMSRDRYGTLYRLTDIVDLAKTALGEEKVKELLRKYRSELHVPRMKNGELQDI